MSEQIKETEIMIGNWFIGYDGKPFQWTTSHFGIIGNEIENVSIGEVIKSPIPLTKDILLKCGVKRIEENKVAIMLNDPSTHLILMKVGTHWYPQMEQTGEFASDGINTVCLNFIDYVHQLQNLFKALTQTDLKV